MKARFLAIAAAAALMAATASAQTAKAQAAPQTEKDKRSYSLGVDAAKNLKARGLDLDLELLVRGVRDGYSGGRQLMTDEDIRATLLALSKEFQQKADAVAKVQADKAKVDGEKFLAANKAKKGITTLPNGLQYEILKAGAGAKPTVDSTVTVHYVGSMIDGTVFDSTLRKGDPVALPVKQIIPGWREALLRMPAGSKWRIFIPPALAYKERRTGPIPPNSVLIFEIELLGIK
ncbi:MAG: FKBP-type peptidyl-prolyl cis-trans isomerase [Acidobacteriota bacterium]|jgi:FKBP-type peptidyl-prolyl cis-trans isomerase|nr:FKBP-type peptidyl-prolyl cis-trans isomerase [Acidobacteriota bacterium]